MIKRLLCCMTVLLFLQTGRAQEKLLYSTNFQDWTSFASTTEVTVPKKTDYSNEDLVFKFYQVTVDSAGENTSRFNYNVVSKGWALAQKVVGSYIETSTLKSITKVQFIQGATGTNRGFKLWKKGLLDVLWVPIYSTPCAIPSGEVVTVLINEPNVAIRFTNIDDTQNAYMFDLKIYGNYVSTKPQYKLDVTQNTAEAGTITKTPDYETYDEGMTVKLQANRNFGYRFVKWTDTLGKVLSTANPYNLTIDANKKIIAVFDTITTYAYNVNIAGTKWAEVQLTPRPVNGKYEAGTVVTMKAVQNAVANFSRWEDNTTAPQRTITVNGNQSFTATFTELPFIVGWNFKTPSPLIGRTGDVYSETTNIGMVSAYDPNGNQMAWTANAGAFTPSYPNVRPGTPAVDFKTKRRYLQADFSTLNYKNIQITSMVGAASQAYAVQALQYSLDNVNFTELARVDISTVYNAGWETLTATLPADAEGKKRVYIRWVADTTSQILGGPSAPDGTSFANVFVYADKYTSVDTAAPVLIAAEPVNGSKTAPINGTIVLNFNEPMKAGSGSITLGSTVLTGTFGSRTVSFDYQKLSYNSQYTLTVPAGALTDLAGNPFPGISVTFNTSVRTQPTKKLFDAVVAQDGSGDYPSVILAIAAAPINRTAPWLIYIKNGKYTGHVDILSNKPFIHLIGQNRDSVIISDNRLAGEDGNQTTPTFPVQQGATVYVNARDCHFENLTIENSYGYEKQSGPQALALYTEADRFTANNVWLRSYQDTYLTAYGGTAFRHYWRNSKIEGAVDFIYGGGDVFFDKCTITCVRKDGGYIVAPSHHPSTLWGYVFSHCTIDEAHASGVTTYFGRPWHQAPKTVFLYTTLKANVYPKGWYYKMNAIPAVFADYGTMDASGNMVDTSFRIEDYEYNKTDSSGNIITIKGKAKKSLTDTEAATYTYDNVVIRNGSNWDPRMMTEAPEKPGKVLLKGSTMSWNDIPYSRLYIIFRDAKVLGFTTNSTYTDSSAVSGNTYTYAVQAVSEYGALSEMTNAVDDTIPPVVSVKNITVALDPSGKVSITADMVDDGSHDESGIDTLTIDKNNFDCSNIGDNQVTLTVKDKKGNAASAIAIVTVKDTTAPVALTQNVTVQLNAEGKALIEATAINKGSYDACGIKSIKLSKTDFDCSNVGSNMVTLTVTDNNDNVSTATATVTVEDKVSPVVRVKNVELNLINGSVLLNPSDLDNGSSDACGISSMTVSRTTFDCTGIGDHTVTFTVTDRNGNSSSASAIVTIKGAIPEPTIVVSRKDTTNTGTSSNTILLGYGAQSLTLTAVDKSSAELKSFIWSPATGLSSTTSANPEFQPTRAGTYTFHVEAFNRNGCPASASVIVNVVDVRCGDMMDKVLVCHYGQVLCINSADVYNHLAHGCKVGPCNNWMTTATARTGKEAEENNLEPNVEPEQNKIKVYPIPSSGSLNVQFALGDGVNYVVELYDLKGALIKMFDRGYANRATVYTRSYDISGLAAGLYVIRLSTNKEIKTEKIIIK
jgi:pectin methylesterase-like acyl-CoA thioesterase